VFDFRQKVITTGHIETPVKIMDITRCLIA
jgi:hypothetical protein